MQTHSGTCWSKAGNKFNIIIRAYYKAAINACIWHASNAELLLHLTFCGHRIPWYLDFNWPRPLLVTPIKTDICTEYLANLTLVSQILSPPLIPVASLVIFHHLFKMVNHQSLVTQSQWQGRKATAQQWNYVHFMMMSYPSSQARGVPKQQMPKELQNNDQKRGCCIITAYAVLFFQLAWVCLKYQVELVTPEMLKIPKVAYNILENSTSHCKFILLYWLLKINSTRED